MSFTKIVNNVTFSSQMPINELTTLLISLSLIDTFRDLTKKNKLK